MKRSSRARDSGSPARRRRSPSPSPSPSPPTGGAEAIQRARADLADRMFIKITSTSILNSSEARLHLCRDGYSALDISWSNDASGGSGTSRTEGSWEVVSAEYTATTATARVRLFNGDGETFRTFFAQGQRVSIDGVDQTQVASSDLCAVRTGRLIAGARPAARDPARRRRADRRARRRRRHAAGAHGRSGAHGAPGRRRCARARGVRERRGPPRARPAPAARRTRPAPARCRGARRRPLRLPPRPTRQRGAAARRRRQAGRHRRAPRTLGTARRGTRGRAAAAGDLDVVRAAAAGAGDRTPRPPGRRRSRARVPSSPSGCSS